MKIRKSVFYLMCLSYLFISISGCRHKDDYSRGIGVYPGNPDEDFSPTLVSDHSYRNIAKLRPVYQSSSYDYNLTGQLVTDGIVINEMPVYFAVTTSQRVIPKNQREWLIDHNDYTGISLQKSPEVYVMFEVGQGKSIPEISKLSLTGEITYENESSGWQITCMGSYDGVKWNVINSLSGGGLPGVEKTNPWLEMIKKAVEDAKKAGKPNPYADFMSPADKDTTSPKPTFTFNFGQPKKARIINQSFDFGKTVAYRFYKINYSAACADSWKFNDLEFYKSGVPVEINPSHKFKSAWMSAGKGEEWLYVDLGASCNIDKVKLSWINKAKKGSIQVSDDAKTWEELAALPGGDNLSDEIQLDGKGRYVKVLMSELASGKNYVLSEMEVYGKGGLVAKPKDSPKMANNRLTLSGGNWKIQRASEVTEPGENISKPDFSNNDWIVATVPGTALVSYWNAGALADPNYSDNQLLISESFFHSDFWYRNEFKVPSDLKGEKLFLNFDGINWKADIYVNGKNIGKIEGAFIRGRFDVSDLIKRGEKNAIAIRIYKNDNIGVIKEATANYHDINGGILGADNPTYHASIGWDWIPTIRGRNIGIWNDVYLDASGSVTIEDPFVYSDLQLPDTTSADISVEVSLINHDSKAVEGKLTGKFGNIVFEEKVKLNPAQSTVIKLNPTNHPELKIKNPKLWWPKGYGAPNLYDVELAFITDDGKVSDKKAFKSGVREMTFDENNQILNMYINGRRFIGMGGNWGFPESNLNYRGREYDAAVAYHADMNFTMIRNWVGQTGDDEFYEACDRHGVMVWQDFWLANPADGPDPSNPAMFMKNADDMVKRIRNHASIGIYVGRNEGNPPMVIDTALRSLITNKHHGLHYISNSASGVVSGGGPYRALPVRDYFLLYGSNKFHSERGMPNVMTYESMEQTMPEDLLWPQNRVWGIHDYSLESAQSCASFNQMIEKGYGKANNAKEFTEFAQWINYDGYRGIFEGRSKNRQGMLLWMSHPAWPSMVWQTYDYYLEPTAAYFGCKKANEPIHIQWNPAYDNIEVVNYHAKDKKDLLAKAQLINMDGSVQWEKELTLSCKEDSTAKCFKLEFPKSLSKVHFIKLTLNEGNNIISENFYWRGLETGNYQALRDIPKVKIETSTKVENSFGGWVMITKLNNNSDQPALMIRLKAIGNSGKRILPVLYSDNYFSLMPGEKKVIITTLKEMDTRGETPSIAVSGFNLK